LNVLLGNGDGTFQSPIQNTVDPDAYLEGIGLAVGDINGDAMTTWSWP
jgi:hypothetical protein